ncbi:4'-phosphopantetheinyl transferase superfamily protein [Pseudooceanicola sp.]|uniref:4'-phosphopantetheinyl transferase family protein n=1 Tax=Pseudooceanicola sp. TaxID=1914328 RepID=UPI0026252F68|nr:4'-phosphopantetheinyl transferase superfamily protein [Pseudooceanicola sp.]MDF1856192.1 4'-phosphopantetheinyl transferase superfamily protein [Pseudooceanicola sp.]
MPLEIPIHIWPLTGDDAHVERMATLLSADESARAARFVFERDRRAHILARGRLRQVLADAMGKTPHDLTFAYGAHGKPALPDGLEFNLSHSDGLACLALHPEVELGVDIEAFREIEDGVAERFFSSREYADLSALPAAHWSAGFFRCWTRKEAVVKAIGDGLSIPLDAFDVTLTPGVPPRMTRLDPARGSLADWTLAHFDLGPGMVGALAVRARGRAIRPVLATCPKDQPFHWSL